MSVIRKIEKWKAEDCGDTLAGGTASSMRAISVSDMFLMPCKTFIPIDHNTWLGVSKRKGNARTKSSREGELNSYRPSYLLLA